MITPLDAEYPPVFGKINQPLDVHRVIYLIQVPRKLTTL